MKKLIITTLVTLPLIVFSAIIINQSAGMLEGEGHAKSHSFSVTAKSFDLNIGDLDANGYRTITMTVPVKEIDTGNGMRNTHMRMSMFDIKKNPDIVFTAKSSAKLTAGKVSLDGTLTINGVTKPHVLTFVLNDKSGDWVASGMTNISLTAYDLPHVGMGPMKIQDQVDMAFNISLPNE